MSQNFLRSCRLACLALGAFAAPAATAQEAVPAADVLVTGLGEPIGRVTGRFAYNTERGPVVGLGVETSRLLGRDQYLRFEVEADENDRRYRLLTRSDDLFGTEPRVALLLESRQQSANDRFDFDLSAASARVGLGWSLAEGLDATTYLLLSRDSIEDVAPGASRLIAADEGTTDRVALGGEIDYVLRDAATGRSLRLDAALEIGKREDAGASYLKLSGGAAATLPAFGGRVVMNQELRAGVLDSRGSVSSIGDRYILGSGTIRGFELAGFGPRDLAAPGEPALGGNRFVTARVTSWFPNAIPGADRVAPGVFVDAASLWGLDDTAGGPNGASPVDDDFNLRSSAGVTARVATEFGTLDLSISHPLLQEDYDETRSVRVSFSQQF